LPIWPIEAGGLSRRRNQPRTHIRFPFGNRSVSKHPIGTADDEDVQVVVRQFQPPVSFERAVNATNEFMESGADGHAPI
jgi:hypothetical protein